VDVPSLDHATLGTLVKCGGGVASALMHSAKLSPAFLQFENLSGAATEASF